MVGKTGRVTKSGIADAQNQIAGLVIVEAAGIAAAAGLFQDHPHINGSNGVLGNAHANVTRKACHFPRIVAKAGSIDLGTCRRMNRLD